ncbi:LysE family translocator [Flavobacteriaceae bacterium]|jgi:threonine/homoserine/homoserine lactone efflux protein|nr:LysE family translocator [Flavobacteriaceae bacterium]
MTALVNFLVGYLASFVGLIPPGLLNMTAAKIGVKQGRKPALIFSIGVIVVVCIQTGLGLAFARYIEQHPEIVDILQKVTLGIFLALTFYFFALAKDTRREIPKGVKRSKTNRFLYGVLLSALNMLPIPYWVYVSISLSALGWFFFNPQVLGWAIFGSAMGTFSMLLIYIYFFRRKLPIGNFGFNLNYLLGAITGLISLITVIRIWQRM